MYHDEPKVSSGTSRTGSVPRRDGTSFLTQFRTCCELHQKKLTS
jgi:hypothetical protein